MELWNRKRRERKLGRKPKGTFMGQRVRFSPRAEAAFSAARKQAAALGHSYVGSEHLLLGLCAEEGGGLEPLLRRYGAVGLKEQSVRITGSGVPGTPPLQGLTCCAAAAAGAAALHRQAEQIGPEDLLLALLEQKDCTAVQILRASGADLAALRLAASEDSGWREGAHGTSRERPAPSADFSMSRELAQAARDLTALAREGRTDPVIGRDSELSRMICILSRRRKNNPVLIGEPGVGKTAVVEELARRIAAGSVPDALQGRHILALSLSGLVAGTKYRGEFEERMNKLLREVRQLGNVILFVDEVHNLVGTGSAEGSIDAANLLKPALSRGEFQMIGATTTAEYRRCIEPDGALERRFQPVLVEEPTQEQAVRILKGLKEPYEAHHGLFITEDALRAAVRLSVRYLPERRLPDKAIDLMDEAGSRVRLEIQRSCPGLPELERRMERAHWERVQAIRSRQYDKAAELGDAEESFRLQREQCLADWCRRKQDVKIVPQDVAAVVSDWTGIPVTALSREESSRLLRLEQELGRRVAGQKEAVSAVARAVRRGRTGLKEPGRPVGCFLFLGPTGVGKTELCKALAQVLFGSEKALLRFDMSEYSQAHTVARLIGAPPGYVGHQEGGQLTDQVRSHPYSVILLDEIEKAHGDLWNLLLQIMEDGVLTDSRGRKADFRSTVVVMTSNVGARRLTGTAGRLGFAPPEAEQGMRAPAAIRSAVLEDLRHVFRPEFLNRLDETIVFRPLGKEELELIARRMLERLAQRLTAQELSLHVTDRALKFLAERSFQPDYGARPLRRAIQTEVADPIADLLLSGRLTAGSEVRVDAGAKGLTVCPDKQRTGAGAAS